MSEARFYYDTVAESHYDPAQQAAAEILLAVPGMDPVLAVHRDEAAAVPETGYLITAKVDVGFPGAYVETSLYRGGIQFSHVRPALSQYGYCDASVRFTHTGRLSVLHTGPAVDYEGYYVGGGEILAERASVLELTDGRVLAAEAVQRNNGANRSHRAVSTQHISRYGVRVSLCRAVESREEAADVLHSIGRGLPLQEADLTVYMMPSSPPVWRMYSASGGQSH